MTVHDDVTAQLLTELGDTARNVAELLGVDLMPVVEQRLPTATSRLAAALLSDNDREAADATRLVMFLRWPDGTDVDPNWWRTPVGQLVARSIGDEHGEAVTQEVAAAMLRVKRGTVSQMLTRGGAGLERHPDGGITRSSVRALLIAREH